MERYFLEKSITDFFNGRNSTNKLELIYSIINEVEIFNSINPFDMEIDLLEIETEVLDILSSDVTTAEIEYLIMSNIFLFSWIWLHGVTLIEFNNSLNPITSSITWTWWLGSLLS